MRYKIVHAAEVAEKDFGVIKVKELFNHPELSSMSLAIIKLNGKNRESRHLVSNSFYYVLTGTGKFVINGEVNDVHPGVLIFIPNGASYYDEGEMTLLAFNSPRFEPSDVEDLANK